jgi:hypothetical protein
MQSKTQGETPHIAQAADLNQILVVIKAFYSTFLCTDLKKKRKKEVSRCT